MKTFVFNPKYSKTPLAALTMSLMGWTVLMPHETSAAITNIAVIDSQFVPSTVTIRQNDSIAWIWPVTNTLGHSTTGLGLWDSGILGPGSFYTNTFLAAQTFPFHCSIHGNQGMVGSVQVNPTNTVAPTPSISVGLCPAVTISGGVGYSYIIQSTADLTNTNAWVTLTNLTLTQPVQLWVDTNVDASLPTHPRRFYRVLPGQ